MERGPQECRVAVERNCGMRAEEEVELVGHDEHDQVDPRRAHHRARHDPEAREAEVDHRLQSGVLVCGGSSFA